MNIILEQSDFILSNTTLDFKSFLFNKIKWNNRLIGIIGARGKVINRYLIGLMIFLRYLRTINTFCPI
jgi:hypothetical protein